MFHERMSKIHGSCMKRLLFDACCDCFNPSCLAIIVLGVCVWYMNGVKRGLFVYTLSFDV
jgi:hypothetical protein